MKNKKNYYSIHLNKKPKHLRQKRFKYKSYVYAKIALITAMSSMQIETIKAQPFKNIEDKKKSILEITWNTIMSILKELNKEKQNRFNQTKRYIK